MTPFAIVGQYEWWAEVEDRWRVLRDADTEPPSLLLPFRRVPDRPGPCTFGRGTIVAWPRDAIHFTALTFPG